MQCVPAQESLDTASRPTHQYSLLFWMLRCTLSISSAWPAPGQDPYSLRMVVCTLQYDCYEEEIVEREQVHALCFSKCKSLYYLLEQIFSSRVEWTLQRYSLIGK